MKPSRKPPLITIHMCLDYNLPLKETLIPAYRQLFPHSYTGYPQIILSLWSKYLF